MTVILNPRATLVFLIFLQLKFGFVVLTFRWQRLGAWATNALMTYRENHKPSSSRSFKAGKNRANLSGPQYEVAYPAPLKGAW